MRRWILGTCFVLSMAAVTAGCGEVPSSDLDAAVDGDAGVDAATDLCAAAELSVDDFFTCMSRGLCDVIHDCFGSDVDHLMCDDLPLQIFDGLTSTAAKRVLADSTARGRVQWQPAAAKACLDKLIDGTCVLATAEEALLESCAVTVGNVTDGQTCQADFECATPGSRCLDPNDDGTCSPTRVCRRPAAINQSCAGGAFCALGDRCVRRISATGANLSTCDTGSAGRPCDGDRDCDPELFCNGGANDGTAGGICTVAKPAGAICRTDRECQGEDLCVGETSSTTGFCRDARPAGATCDSVLGCWGNQYCAGPSGSPGTCQPAPGLGGACGTSLGQGWCGATLACQAGVCVRPGDVGATCTQSPNGVFATSPDTCNSGLFCDNDISGANQGQCVGPRADGAVCNQRDQCTSGFCDGATCAPFPVCSL